VRQHALGLLSFQGLAEVGVPIVNAKIHARKTQDADISFSVNVLDFVCFTMVAQVSLVATVE